jgi:hypothetical protein
MQQDMPSKKCKMSPSSSKQIHSDEDTASATVQLHPQAASAKTIEPVLEGIHVSPPSQSDRSEGGEYIFFHF